MKEAAGFGAFARICDAVGATAKKLEKVRLVAEYLRALAVEDASIAAIFFTGRAFARWEERVLAVGGSILWNAVERIANPDAGQAHKTYLKHGDLGDMANELLAGRSSSERATGTLALGDVAKALAQLAAVRGNGAKLIAVEELLRQAQPIEAKYIVKIVTGDLRIGLRESLVEEAIAQAYGRTAEDVRRANMLGGDIAATLRLAAADELQSAKLRLLHPIGFMLASPVDTPEEALEYFPQGALVEDKLDGIRAQVHKSEGKVKLFSRTLDEIVEFPELYGPLESLPGEFILDGEVLGWKDGRPLPFTELQKRLGRKQADMWLMQDIPVRFVAFDLLYRDGELLLDLPLKERRMRLKQIFSSGAEALVTGTAAMSELKLRPPKNRSIEEKVAPELNNDTSGSLGAARRAKGAPVSRALGMTDVKEALPTVGAAESKHASNVEEIEAAFLDARQRGHEGIMVKNPASPYKPGQRGRHWLKLKRPLATLDVVVTSVEFGHGKRRGLLSDYTFAVRGPDDRLLNIGKAYSGLTDVEIKEYTDYFQQHTLVDHGGWRTVEPTVVLEVAFNNVQRSSRHESGYALRFPRIVRIRTDKTPEEIDTLHRVSEIFAKQGASEDSK